MQNDINEINTMLSQLHPSFEEGLKRGLIGTMTLVLKRHQTLTEEMNLLESDVSIDDFNSWG